MFNFFGVNDFSFNHLDQTTWSPNPPFPVDFLALAGIERTVWGGKDRGKQ
jgi:hypothetical protein